MGMRQVGHPRWGMLREDSARFTRIYRLLLRAVGAEGIGRDRGQSKIPNGSSRLRPVHGSTLSR
jgi:hypothetical protein